MAPLPALAPSPFSLSLYLNLLNLTRNPVRAVTATSSSGYTDRSSKYRGRSSCSVLLSWGVGTQGSRISLADHRVAYHLTSSHGFFFFFERERGTPHTTIITGTMRACFLVFVIFSLLVFLFLLLPGLLSLLLSPSLSPPRPLSLSAFAS